MKAKELSTDPEFKASLGWYSNWKRRHSISMRAKTSLAQRLPADMEDKVVEFHRFVLRSRQRWGYDLSRILNMDKTPMRFELPATRTLGVYREQNSPSVVMRRRQAKFHGCSDSESERRKTPTESHIQRCSAAEYQHATKDANFSTQERLDGRRRYVLSPHCLFREGTFRASDKHDSRNSKLYCCHGYQVTEHVLLSTYANFHLFAFLLKSFSILKVFKGSILFLIHRN